MNNLELYQNLIVAYKNSLEYDSIETKELRFEDNSEVREILSEANINIEEKNQKLCFEKSALPFSFYNDLVEYKEEVTNHALNKDCVIHTYEKETYLWYEFSTGSTSKNSETIEEDYVFSNAKTYFELLAFLEDKSNHVPGDTDFTDFFSKTTRKIVLASLSEKKRITFVYPQTGIPELDFKINYKNGFEEFINLYSENKHFPIFLKNSIISNLDKSGKNSFLHFFQYLDKINLDAKLNFNVYLHQLSLDKIKTEYKEYKQKYYGSQSDILSKLSSQVLALPLSIAGSAFALYKLENAKFALVLICLGLVGFIVYLSNMVSIYWNDLKILNAQMQREFDTIKGQDFFIENTSELKYFEQIKTDLQGRVKKLCNSIRIFSVSIWLLDIFLIIYGVDLIFNFEKETLFFLFIGAIAIYTCLDVFILFPKENNEK